MSSLWFSHDEIIPDKNKFNELISLIASHGLECMIKLNNTIIMQNDKYIIAIIHDDSYTNIKRINILHPGKKSTYTWLRGFTMNDHRNVYNVLRACDEFGTNDSSLDELIAYHMALSE
jgi:hypothetical protein